MHGLIFLNIPITNIPVKLLLQVQMQVTINNTSTGKYLEFSLLLFILVGIVLIVLF